MQEKEFLGFEEQDNRYECGGYSIRHALLALGKPVSRHIVKKLAGTKSFWEAFVERGTISNAGTSEEGIQRAIRRIGFAPKVFEPYSVAVAKRTIDRFLDSGVPVILYVGGENDHWATAIGRVKEKYLIADSADGFKYPVKHAAVALYGWRELIDNRWYDQCQECGNSEEGSYADDKEPGEAWCEDCDGSGDVACDNCEGEGCELCHDNGIEDCKQCKGTGVVKCEECGGSGYYFYGIAVVPKEKVYRKHNAVIHAKIFSETLVRNVELQEYWGYILSDLIDSFGDPSSAGKRSMKADEFFDKYGQTISENAQYWLAGMTKSEIERELDNYRLVAMSYDMKFDRSTIDQRLISFTMAFTMTLADWYVFS